MLEIKAMHPGKIILTKVDDGLYTIPNIGEDVYLELGNDDSFYLETIGMEEDTLEKVLDLFRKKNIPFEAHSMASYKIPQKYFDFT